MATDIAKKHNLELVENYKNYGVSAFKGKNTLENSDNDELTFN